jgi:predicted TIM-barrel fold metal-dependent hydrolase
VDLPLIISVDDHIVEPPTLWQDRLPAKYRERGPRVERVFGSMDFGGGKSHAVVADPDAPGAKWCDQWRYDDLTRPMLAGMVAIGDMREVLATDGVTYDEMARGCWEQSARLADMDANHTEASLCFPTLPRFCGQTFLEREDKELALLCVQAYNDWMIDDWCAGEGKGRLIPLTIIPLWDAEAAAVEIRRCADKGSHAVAFSECPAYLGLPSIHSGHWDPFFAACEETDTVINMHIGSSSRLPSTSDDAPLLVTIALTFQNSQNALVDWLLSGALSRFPDLRIALSEGQVGWMPFLLERIDKAWERGLRYERDAMRRVPDRPSTYIHHRVYGCIFDDLVGLMNREQVGMDQIVFETDYPHEDSTFPHSREVAERLVTAAGLSETETWQFMRGNAIRCYGLDRHFGIVE